MLNFNEAEEQSEYSLIPENTIARAKLLIKPDHDSYITRSKNGESTYLNCEFAIVEGPYVNRRVFDKLGVSGSEAFVNMGRSRIRAILESARGISSKDTSAVAVSARKINSFVDINGLEATIKIGVKVDKTGQYPPSNCVALVITPDLLERER
jgi:hypothetical protein